MTPRAHVAVAAVIAITILLILRMLRSGQLRSKYAILWIAVAVGLLPLAAFPDQVLIPLSRAVGIHYEPATILFAASAFLFLVVVEFSWELSRLEDRTRRLAEEVALLSQRLDVAQAATSASGSSADDETVGDERSDSREGSLGSEQQPRSEPQGSGDLVR